MPTFNQASFLRRAILSLRAQTFTNWELLIVDDGSSDETPALLAELRRDSRIRDWRLDENSGFPRALNLALEVACAPYLAYLPSDDYFCPNHLESLRARIGRTSGGSACLLGHPLSPAAE